MKRAIFTLALALLFCTSMFAQSYSFKTVNCGDPNVPFTQLLGINNSDVIAGYHNFNQNMGFTLVLPNAFTPQNFPNSAMTQVIGINNKLTTDGFYVDNSGITHGFFRTSNGTFQTVDYPGAATSTSFNQLLSQNDYYEAAGYYSNSINNTTPDIPYIYDEVGGVFKVLTIPGAVGGAQATGINNSAVICGFFIDSNGINHGWLLNRGIFMPLDFPGSTGTQALGLNNHGQVVGFYSDAGGETHGYVYYIGTAKFVTVDAPNGVGTTIVNGINDAGKLVGFYGTAPVNVGFVATPVNAAANGGVIGPDARGTQLSSVGSVEPPVVPPVAVEREIQPTSPIVVEPPVAPPVAVDHHVAPNTTRVVLDPPSDSPNAVNGR